MLFVLSLSASTNTFLARLSFSKMAYDPENVSNQMKVREKEKYTKEQKYTTEEILRDVKEACKKKGRYARTRVCNQGR
jgi:uncharacterized protein YwgA